MPVEVLHSSNPGPENFVFLVLLPTHAYSVASIIKQFSLLPPLRASMLQNGPLYDPNQLPKEPPMLNVWFLDYPYNLGHFYHLVYIYLSLSLSLHISTVPGLPRAFHLL